MEFEINTPVRVRDDIVTDSNDYVPGTLGVMVRNTGTAGREQVQCIGTEGLFTIDPDWLVPVRLTPDQITAIKAQVEAQVAAHPVTRVRTEAQQTKDRIVATARTYGEDHGKSTEVEQMISRMGLPARAHVPLTVTASRTHDVYTMQNRPEWDFDANVDNARVTGNLSLSVTVEVPAGEDIDDVDACDYITRQMVEEAIQRNYPRTHNVNGFRVDSWVNRNCSNHHNS